MPNMYKGKVFLLYKKRKVRDALEKNRVKTKTKQT